MAEQTRGSVRKEKEKIHKAFIIYLIFDLVQFFIILKVDIAWCGYASSEKKKKGPNSGVDFHAVRSSISSHAL